MTHKEFRPEFEGGQLVKIDGHRPDYMSGYGLIRSTKVFAARWKEAADLLALALPYVEEAAADPAHKPGPVNELAARIRAAIGGQS